MHTHSVLQKFFTVSLPAVHPHRRDAVVAAVESVTQGATVSITSMGRGLPTATRIQHRVKRRDRLVGNRLLYAERDRFYQAMIQRLLAHCARPIIVIDWSDFSDDRQQQLLRAVLLVGGRGLTLYKELHPCALERAALPFGTERFGEERLVIEFALGGLLAHAVELSLEVFELHFGKQRSEFHQSASW